MKNLDPIICRPGTLAEVVRQSRSDVDQLRTPLAGFLDEFYLDLDVRSRRSRIVEDPGFIGDARMDAFIGAVGEHLCHRWILGDPPEWTSNERRFLGAPWFIGSERMKPFLLAESPSAFRRRFIFTEAEPLRRATMPRDGRWWFYEGIRSGLKPGEGDVAAPCVAGPKASPA